MNIALIGATGFVGKILTQELLQRGHHVTAIARHADALPPQENLTVKEADVFEEDDFVNAISSADVVLSAYNPGWTNPDLYNEYLRGAKAIQAATKKASVKRLFVIGGAGSLYVAPGQQIVDTEGFPAEWKPGALAARDYLNIIKEEKELDWTFISPAIEMHAGTSGTRKGTYRTGLENPVFDEQQRSVISAEDLSVAIADELEKPAHSRQRFTVAY
ncbi:MAG: NAD-dependent epimerase/dehydratase family protein [Ferruginibacter sp.]|nr:NAD-dependent epimerase/dehydratase family protein [Ferruginibacter sp.]